MKRYCDYRDLVYTGWAESGIKFYKAKRKYGKAARIKFYTNGRIGHYSDPTFKLKRFW